LPKIGKNLPLKKTLIFSPSKVAIYLVSLGLHQPSALKREHPALQNMQFLNFFLFLWVILPSWIGSGIPNPDPLT
jgi:hypothetical protein